MISIWLVVLGLAIVLFALLVLRLHAFLALILAALAISILTPTSALQGHADAQVAANKMSDAEAKKFVASEAPSRVVAAFGDTCAKIGLLIAMAAIIGKCLLDSGAAVRIVQMILDGFGQARAHVAFVLSGFLLAIPVFFEAVFFLLMPLGKAMARRAGANYLLYILTVIAGATMAHSLVPPTPGPLFAAKTLGVDIATMMAGGLIVGLATASFGLAYAIWANKRWTIPLPPDAAAVPEIDPARLPPLWLSLLPIVLPVALITWGALADRHFWFTESNVALCVGAAVALVLLTRHRLPGSEPVHESVQHAISSGASVLLITAAGGAFGATLRHTGIAELIQHAGAGMAGHWALPICFAVTALVRIAQGSATVAMITAAPIASAILESGNLGFHPVYLALAVGCGSKPIPWMNDSGFWVVTRMTGMKEMETLKIVTPMMSLMGVVGLPVVMLGAWLFPMM